MTSLHASGEGDLSLAINDRGYRRGWTDAYVLCGLFTVILLTSCSKWFSPYDSFIAHDKKYFSEITAGCEALLSRTNRTPQSWILAGNDQCLPAALKNLKATKISVVKRSPVIGGDDETEVRIIFGEARGGFAVAWTPKDTMTGLGSGQLVVLREEEPGKAVVFSK